MPDAFWEDLRRDANDPDWLAAYLEAFELTELHDLEDVAAEFGIDLT